MKFCHQDHFMYCFGIAMECETRRCETNKTVFCAGTFLSLSFTSRVRAHSTCLPGSSHGHPAHTSCHFLLPQRVLPPRPVG